VGFKKRNIRWQSAVGIERLAALDTCSIFGCQQVVSQAHKGAVGADLAGPGRARVSYRLIQGSSSRNICWLGCAQTTNTRT
jgi:hypothetical protein